MPSPRCVWASWVYPACWRGEARAWELPKGKTAVAAAGKIHTDMERGFIRAEVVGIKDLTAAGSIRAAREAGTYRTEGRDYVVEDGDVMLILFSV